MNKKRGIFFGFAVLLTAAIFTFAGCGDIFDSSSKGDDDDDSTSNSGNNGSTAPSAPSTLTITGIPAEHNGKFVAAFDSEDAPTIVALADNTGKAQQIKNRSVTLSVFSVAGGDLTNLTPYTGNGYVTMRLGIFNTAEPGEDSFVDGTDIIVSFTNGGATARYLDIDDDDNDDAGRLTITGLAGYEGMRVYAEETPVGGHIINTSASGVIENGLVTLSVYERNGDDYTPYTGNDKNVTIEVWIYDGAGTPASPYQHIATATITVSFTNGNATFNCDPSSIVDLTLGTLTITGLTAYEGKRVQVEGHKGELYFSASASRDIVENGSVTLDMFYKIGEDRYSYTFYKGNDQDVPMEVVICNGDGSSASPYEPIAYAGITVSFTKGSATVACDSSSFIDSDDVSRLTITGLSAYEGKRVQVKGYIGELYLSTGIRNWERDQPVIADGSVTLYVDCEVGEQLTLYTGNDQDVSMEVLISAGWSINVIASADITVSFTVGHATVDCSSSSFTDLTSAGGRLTLTGLNAYEGKRVSASGSIGVGEEALNFRASITRDDGVQPIIENGLVTLFVYCAWYGMQPTLYTGNDQVPMSVLISDAETQISIARATITVSFTDGNATKAVEASDITY